MDTIWTPEKWQQVFLRQLSKTGNVSDACRKAKVARSQAYAKRESEKGFADAWEEALEIAVERLELEARRRAERGVLEPVYYLGQKVGAVRKYSDTLLIFLLKAHKPRMYRDSVKHEHTGADGGPIQYRDVSELSDDELAAIASAGR